MIRNLLQIAMKELTTVYRSKMVLLIAGIILLLLGWRPGAAIAIIIQQNIYGTKQSGKKGTVVAPGPQAPAYSSTLWHLCL